MLKDRSRRILSLLVETFVSTGEPVGSRTLAKAGLGVSPATIRNEMADLEEAGFLAQPHTSAGRVPTDKAYRYWLDQQDLTEFHSVEDDQATLRALDERYLTECRGLEDLLANTCRILSQVCAVAGVATPRSLTDVETRIQLVGLDRNHIMAVLVAESGLASSHILSVAHSMSQEELNKISRVFNESASRSSVRDLLSHRVERLRVLEKKGRELARSILGKLEQALMQAESEVFYDGLSRVFQSPDPAGEQHAGSVLRQRRVPGPAAQGNWRVDAGAGRLREWARRDGGLRPRGRRVRLVERRGDHRDPGPQAHGLPKGHRRGERHEATAGGDPRLRIG
jgi:heat-inducible transcriptional repressor